MVKNCRDCLHFEPAFLECGNEKIPGGKSLLSKNIFTAIKIPKWCPLRKENKNRKYKKEYVPIIE